MVKEDCDAFDRLFDDLKDGDGEGAHVEMCLTLAHCLKNQTSKLSGEAEKELIWEICHLLGHDVSGMEVREIDDT